MKKLKDYLAILVALLLLASCSSIQPPFTQLMPYLGGQTRLTGIEMPDYVREGLDYDVILRYDSEETPQFNRVCFRWLTEPISSASPSLNCYAASGDFGTGSPCGPASLSSSGSSSFCADASDIRADIPGRLVVRIRPNGLQPNYNMLEGQAEYVRNKELKVTNAVKTPVTVDNFVNP
jgi:hypothetical protein